MSASAAVGRGGDDGVTGSCPSCGGSDGYLNLGRDHWGVCHACRTCWPLGGNLFSSWRYDPAELHDANGKRLAEYAVVEPVFPRALAVIDER